MIVILLIIAALLFIFWVETKEGMVGGYWAILIIVWIALCAVSLRSTSLSLSAIGMSICPVLQY